MISDVLDLSWTTIFLFGIKAISAWLAATLVVVGPPYVVGKILDRLL